MDDAAATSTYTTPSAPCRRLERRVAIVTGAAHGIGRAIATRLCQEGARVAVVDVLGDVAAETARSLPAAMAVETDVTDVAQLEAMVAQVRERLGEISILVNNAGGAIIAPKPMWEFTAEEWDFLMRLNLMSQWQAVKAVLPSMRAAADAGTSGKIVNITSMAREGRRGLGVYGAAKAGVVSITRTLALELGDLGINVNAVAPGFTRFTRPKPVLTAEQVTEWEQRAVASQAIHRLGQPEDVANAVAFLVSPDADHITGEVLGVTGG